MATYHRFNVTTNDSETIAYCPNTRTVYKDVSKEKLYNQVKNKENSPFILRRKNKWLVFFEMPENRTKNKK